MKKAVYSLCLVFLLIACTTVSFLPTKDTAYTPTNYLYIYYEEPEEPYIIIGQLIAMSEWDVEDAFWYLKNKAMEIGAHAIIMKSAEGLQNVTSVYVIPYTVHRLEALAIRFE